MPGEGLRLRGNEANKTPQHAAVVKRATPLLLPPTLSTQWPLSECSLAEERLGVRSTGVQTSCLPPCAAAVTQLQTAQKLRSAAGYAPKRRKRAGALPGASKYAATRGYVELQGLGGALTTAKEAPSSGSFFSSAVSGGMT